MSDREDQQMEIVDKNKEMFVTGGIFPLMLMLILLIPMVTTIFSGFFGSGTVLSGIAGIVGAILVFYLLGGGLFSLKPNQAAVGFFLTYRGTYTGQGFYYTYPWYSLTHVSMMRESLPLKTIKVVDKNNNPLMISAKVSIRVSCPYTVTYEAEDYETFCEEQAELSVRDIARTYTYEQLSKKPNTINAQLKKLIQSRLDAVGVKVETAGISELSYSKEVATAMLKKQQALALIDARKTMVAGVSEMIDETIKQMDEKSNILTDEDKSKMVRQLMVTLTSDGGVTNVLDLED